MAEQEDGYVSSYHEEGFIDSLARAFRTKPLVMTSCMGLIGACSYGVYRYKTKGITFTPSLFLIQLRVGAQGAVIGCLTAGMVYKMVTEHLLKKKEKQ